MSWKLVDPLGNQFRGEITRLTIAEASKLRGGWFNWTKYMKHPGRQHIPVYKLQRAGYTDILGIVAIYYADGVGIDSLEIAPHSRMMPSLQRQYVNLCDIMIAFSFAWGLQIHNDDFIGLVPKSGLKWHYINKYQAYDIGSRLGIYRIPSIVTSKLIGLYYY